MSREIKSIKYILKHTVEADGLFFPIHILNAAVTMLYIYCSAYISKHVINSINNESENRVVTTIILLIAVIGGCNVIQIICKRQINWRMVALLHGFVEKKNEACLTMEYQKYESEEIQNLNTKANQATRQSENYGIFGFYTAIGHLIVNTGIILVSVIEVTKVNLYLLFALGVCAYMAFATLNKFKVIDKKKYWNIAAKYERIQKYLTKLASSPVYARDLRLYSFYNLIDEKNAQNNKELYKIAKTHYMRWVNCDFVMNTCKFVQEALIYSWLIYSILSGRFDVGRFSFYLIILQAYSKNILQLFDMLSGIKRYCSEIDDYIELLEISKKCYRKNIRFESRKKETDCIMELKNVWFKYEKQDDYTLKNINLKIDRNDTLAVVGINGAGKSTLIKLLSGLYSPTKGEIIYYFDEKENIDMQTIDKAFSVGWQNANILPAKLSENISLKLSDETDMTKLNYVLQRIEFVDNVETWRDSINTQLTRFLSDEGREVSGGERQKIVMCRVLYKNSQITILDEPTAAMDPLAEERTYKLIQKSIDGAVIYVSHRMTSTKFCRHIIVLSNGEIAEEGSYDDLLEHNGLYSQMIRTQTRGYT